MSDNLFKLSKKHLEQLLEKGYAEVTLPNGLKVIVDYSDLWFKKEELDAYLEKQKGGNA